MKLLGLGGLVAGAPALLAAWTGRAHGQAAGGTPPPPATTTPPAPAAPGAEARALHARLVARYGGHLDDAQKEALLGALEPSVQGSNALRAKVLANAVEPDFVFRAERPKR